jgi:hypothetical protein
MVGRRALGRMVMVAVPLFTVCLVSAWMTASGRGSSAGAVEASARPSVCRSPAVDASPRPVAGTSTERVVIGASVTQLIARELRSQIPGIVVDARGGRSWAIRSTGDGPTLWQAYLAHRASMRAGDWLVMETTRGDIPLAMSRTCIESVKATLPRGACLAWVIPHGYYGVQTAAMRKWNAETGALIRSELGTYPCHAVIDWDSLVNAYQARATGLTAAQRALGAPLVYDGRHPTALGASVLAAAIKQATATGNGTSGLDPGRP